METEIARMVLTKMHAYTTVLKDHANRLNLDVQLLINAFLYDINATVIMTVVMHLMRNQAKVVHGGSVQMMNFGKFQLYADIWSTASKSFLKVVLKFYDLFLGIEQP